MLTLGQSIERVQRLVGSVTGGQAKAIDREYVSGLLHQNRRELLPIVPQGWHTNADYRTAKRTMPHASFQQWPYFALPTDLLDLAGGIPSVVPLTGEPNPVSRMFYDEGQFQAAVRQMTNEGLGEYLFLQTGTNMAFWPIPRVNRDVLVSYVALPPDVVSYDATFHFPERGYNILFAKTAADCKAFDDNPTAMAAMDARYEREWTRAMALQGLVAAADPFKTKQG
jgi:hypothetical protein